MEPLVRRLTWPRETSAAAPPSSDSNRRSAPSQRDLAPFLDREWLVTNGLGGYASGTISGAPTRRYHGALISAQPGGRVMMLNHLTEQFRLSDYSAWRVGGSERKGGNQDVHGFELLEEFRLEMGLPVWRYHIAGHTIEKRLFMPYRHNTVHISYRLLEGAGAIRLKLRPSVNFRGHDDAVGELPRHPYVLTAVENRYELGGERPYPSLRLRVLGDEVQFSLDNQKTPDILYRTEENRGYESVGALWSPGLFRVWLHPGCEATLTASTDDWANILAMSPEDALDAEMQRRRRLISLAAPVAREGFGAELVLAADQFVVTPATRIAEAVRATALGDEARTVIAGYHWFTDWGRDTMISLEGLALCTGRHDEAGYILRTFASHIRNGLIPNLFPEGDSDGLYHTADATLWMFQALSRYIAVSQDRSTLDRLLPKLVEIAEHHLRGTRFGIGVDPADGLLRQGEPGYQLTWMDAKVGDWVVTPRRGKAVEINALWYNALRLLEQWLRESRKTELSSRADDFGEAAERNREAFNDRFWFEQGGYLYDIVDGEEGRQDEALRPNQVLAISLAHPVLEESRWRSVVDVVERELVTPVGLRSLGRDHPDYKPKYYGDLRARDAAYHQGTVWTWLIGPFIDAWMRVHSERAHEARRFLDGIEEHLSSGCIGSISEVFDAEAPFAPRGCIAQAWSVAETLRCLLKTAAAEPGAEEGEFRLNGFEKAGAGRGK